MLSGLLASLGFAGGVLIDKFELSKRRMPMRQFLPTLFVTLAVFTGLVIVMIPSTFHIGVAALSLRYLFAFAAMILLAFGWNIYYYIGLAKEAVAEFDLILLTEPLVTIVLASIFFVNERNPIILILALIAALALIIAHLRHRKIRLDHAASGLLISVLLMSLEVLVIRILLDAYSPVALYFMRVTVLAVIFCIKFKPRISMSALPDMRVVAVSGAFGALQMLARYVGYSSAGIVVTTLALLLGPVLVEMISVLILREKVTLKSATAFLVILLSVAYASFIHAAYH